MASILKNVVIIGGGGNIGKMVLDALVSSGQFNISAIQRKESSAVFPSVVKTIKSDFSDASLEEAFKGQDAVVSTVGATGFTEQQKFVDAALRAGVKRFIPSELSASSEDEAVIELLPLFGVKKNLIDYLKSKESDGLSWTGIATSGLLDWGLTTGFLQYDLQKHTAVIWDSGDKRFTTINEKALGQSVVSVLQHPAETSNKYLYVASVETSQNELLRALEKETGTKWSVTRVKTDEVVSEAQKQLAAGDFNGAFSLVRAMVVGNIPGLRANYVKDTDLANDLLGLKLETVEETVKRALS
ncbi:NmrA-like family protein [Penicillium chermesinum]|uniref:NmrA-like family protein n=1 Tax=Penicillium chermesinum TaxID=63820 RepID=A0A9W9NHE7_9EURO|nr:NmrA-like family protein [Penicillium chermesinum]KAJ5220079.1 NmrA-like family protein [Penicillium chermesinum]KAJ6157528.1 NmrA-like family protein [Penicillium chermesinum]